MRNCSIHVDLVELVEHCVLSLIQDLRSGHLSRHCPQSHPGAVAANSLYEEISTIDFLPNAPCACRESGDSAAVCRNGANGPDLPFMNSLRYCDAARGSGRSYAAQHFDRSDVSNAGRSHYSPLVRVLALCGSLLICTLQAGPQITAILADS